MPQKMPLPVKMAAAILCKFTLRYRIAALNTVSNRNPKTIASAKAI